MRTRHSSSNPVPPFDFAHGKSQRHQPVLLHESLDALDVQPDDIAVDATLGGAGHAKGLAKGLGGNGLFVGFDADPEAVERARRVLADSKTRMHLVCANFRDLESELKKRGITKITKILFDLGWSSYQLDSGRGFSFQRDEPLLMTYGTSAEGVLTAEHIVNEWSEKSLADVIYGFGEERYARRIAKRIVESRKLRPIKTTTDLVRIIQEATPLGYRRGRIHPATRTFQALRIAVNDELSVLQEGLSGAWKILAVRGRIAVISFHSIEDRVVKQTFARWVKQGEGRPVTKKPIGPSREEVAENPRARSAKLRVIEKISYESQDAKNKQVRPLDISGKA